MAAETGDVVATSSLLHPDSAVATDLEPAATGELHEQVFVAFLLQRSEVLHTRPLWVRYTTLQAVRHFAVRTHALVQLLKAILTHRTLCHQL